jgi:hypothetical protein
MANRERQYDWLHTPRSSRGSSRTGSSGSTIPRAVPRGNEPEPQPRRVIRNLPDYQQRTPADLTAIVKPKTSRKKLVKKWWRPAAVALVLLLIGTFGLIKNQGDTEQQDSKTSFVDEANEVLGIKTGEAPVVMTVSDKNALTQPFLKQAENGDQVLFYYQAKKVAVIRPATSAILAYGDFTPPPARVFVRSGSKNASVAAVVDSIKKDSTLSFVSQDASPLPAYFDSIVIDLSGRYPEEAKRLAANVSGNVTGLPDGESRPDADILVIIGGR